MLKDVEKGVSIFILLCVGQLWLVAVFIVRAFEVSVYAVFPKECYMYVISLNIAHKFHSSSCNKNKTLLFSARQDLKQASGLYFGYNIEMLRSVQINCPAG